MGQGREGWARLVCTVAVPTTGGGGAQLLHDHRERLWSGPSRGAPYMYSAAPHVRRAPAGLGNLPPVCRLRHPPAHLPDGASRPHPHPPPPRLAARRTRPARCPANPLPSRLSARRRGDAPPPPPLPSFCLPLRGHAELGGIEKTTGGGPHHSDTRVPVATPRPPHHPFPPPHLPLATALSEGRRPNGWPAVPLRKGQEKEKKKKEEKNCRG